MQVADHRLGGAGSAAKHLQGCTVRTQWPSWWETRTDCNPSAQAVRGRRTQTLKSARGTRSEAGPDFAFQCHEDSLMSQPQPLPSLFGRFTAILQDHDHLAKTLRLLRLMCNALEEGQTALPLNLDPKRLLGELHRDLAEHFAAEESPEYFGTVVEEAPSLVAQVAGLKWEHLTMLRAVEVLREIAELRNRWSELPLPTHELVGQLQRHEQAESTLLRQLFAPPRG